MLRYTGQTHSRKNMWVESFLTMANSKFWVNKLNCVGHRMFLFLLKLRRALTNKPFMAADCWRLGYNFHVYSYLAATYKSTGAPCQNNTFMDRWLKVMFLHKEYFRYFFFFFYKTGILLQRNTQTICQEARHDNKKVWGFGPEKTMY